MKSRVLFRPLAQLTQELLPCYKTSLTWSTGQRSFLKILEWRSILTSATIRGEVISFPLAQTGEGIAECELIKWLVREGDSIKQFDKICEVQSDKASIEITSPYDGMIKSTPYKVGDIIPVGKTLVEIEIEGNQTLLQESDSQKTEHIVETASTTQGTKPLASPAVRYFAKEQNVELTDIQPTGPSNRVLKEDIERFLKQRTPQKGRIEIKGYRRAMLKSMTMSLQIPHFHFTDDVDLTELSNLRQQVESDDRLVGRKFTYLPILIKALSMAMIDFPEINSSLSEDHEEIIIHSEHHIGVAMMTESGLIVPNIKNVEQKSVLEILDELDILREAAKKQKLTVTELAGTTITVSNIGPVGGCYATPLITPPQAAIVALGRVRSTLLPSDDIKNIKTIPSLPISWGADHRILDGATVVRFSNKWKELIENPGRLILALK